MTPPTRQATYFTKIGIGNDTLVNTEIEFPDGTETRQPGFIYMRPISLYLRLWLGQKVYILDLRNGFSTKSKPRKTFKLLLGITGYPGKTKNKPS